MRSPIWRTAWNFLSRSRSFDRIIFYSIFNPITRLKMNFDVVHDESNSEFYISLGKEKAVLQYQFLDNNVMDMYHTGVPESQRGNGIAGHLVKAALSFVVKKDLKVLPTCSYVQHYINKNKSQEIIERVVHNE